MTTPCNVLILYNIIYFPFSSLDLVLWFFGGDPPLGGSQPKNHRTKSTTNLIPAMLDTFDMKLTLIFIKRFIFLQLMCQALVQAPHPPARYCPVTIFMCPPHESTGQ